MRYVGIALLTIWCIACFGFLTIKINHDFSKYDGSFLWWFVIIWWAVAPIALLLFAIVETVAANEREKI